MTILKIVCLADFGTYKNNVEKLKSLLREKGQIQSELTVIDEQLELLNRSDSGWLTKRKISKFTSNKAKLNDQIFLMIEKISFLRKECNNEFNNLYEENVNNINQIIANLSSSKDNSNELLSHLLDEKSRRDFLINSQKYFSSIDNKSFALNQNIDFFKFENKEIVQDFIELLNIKIHNIEIAKSSATKEIKMRQKLNSFRSEISTIQEPETFTVSSRSTVAEDDKSYDNDWSENITDESINNYSNTLKSSSENLETFEELTSEEDFLLLFEESDEQSINYFINKMDSLKSYYSEILQELSKRQ